ncbi:MAG: hypothetical protein RL235_319 [Chlamydiota bacterium]|jgi:hypothetical protein
MIKPKKRQKLCHNCEGEIDVDVIVCPFCAADLREEKPEQKQAPADFDVSARNQRTMQSLYPSSPPLSEPVDIAPRAHENFATDDAVETPNVFTPTILFTVGVQLFLFGLLMLLFSHKGVIILKWNASHWFLYITASLPFLAFGYRALSKL